MFKNAPHVQNKIRLHVKYLLNVNSLEIIWSSFLLLILIKNAIKNAVTTVIKLYMVRLENRENQNSEIVVNTSEACSFEFASYEHCYHKVYQNIIVLRNFAKFTGKHLCQSLKKEALAQVFSCEFCEISKNTFFMEHLRVTASEVK